MGGEVVGVIWCGWRWGGGGQEHIVYAKIFSTDLMAKSDKSNHSHPLTDNLIHNAIQYEILFISNNIINIFNSELCDVLLRTDPVNGSGTVQLSIY